MSPVLGGNAHRHLLGMAGALVTCMALVGCGGGAGGDGDAGSVSQDAESALNPSEQGTYLHVIVPSVVRKDEPVDLKLRVITRAGLPDYDFEGAFRIDSSSPDVKFPEPPTMDPVKEGFYVMRDLSFGAAGVQFVRGSVPGDTVQALANPVNVVSDAGWNVYWGDLNGSSDLSTGSRAPGVYCWYAKSVGLLDFVALTDHDAVEDKSMDSDTFLEVAEVIDEHDQPGEFVTLPAFEWSSPQYGHRLVYFADLPGELPAVAAGVDTPEKLRAALGSDDLVAVAHPSGSAMAPAVDPSSAGAAGATLVEVYSQRGIFEVGGTHRPSSQETPGASVQDLLAAGLRAGFVAGGDGELTSPGNPRAPAYSDYRYPGGLTAVLARELTREAVLEALRERRTYVTTGPRYLLEFTVDGELMGSELRVPKGHRAEVYGAVGGTSDWVHLEVIGPAGTIGSVTPEPGAADVVDLRLTTEPIESDMFVYLRGIDATGGMAWSSPVWFITE